MNNLELLNRVIKIVQPINDDNMKAESLQQNPIDIGLDSLGVIMLLVYLGEIYGVPEDQVKEFKFADFEEMFSLFEQKAVKNHASADEAMASIGY